MARNEKSPWWKPGIDLFLKSTVWIVGPLFTALFVGKWLDGRFGTHPWVLIGSLSASFIFSNILLIKESKRALREINSNDNDGGKSGN